MFEQFTMNKICRTETKAWEIVDANEKLASFLVVACQLNDFRAKFKQLGKIHMY